MKKSKFKNIVNKAAIKMASQTSIQLWMVTQSQGF
jgi:hypothetical protein